MQRANDKILIIDNQATAKSVYDELLLSQGEIQIHTHNLSSDLIEVLLRHLQINPSRKISFIGNLYNVSAAWNLKFVTLANILLGAQAWDGVTIANVFQSQTLSHHLALIKHSIEATLTQIAFDQGAADEPKAKRRKVDAPDRFLDGEKIKVYALFLTQLLEIRPLKQETISHLLLVLAPSQRMRLYQFIQAILNHAMQLVEVQNTTENTALNFPLSNTQVNQTSFNSSSVFSSFALTSSEPRMQPSLLSTQTQTQTQAQIQMITEPLFVFGEDGFSQEFHNPHLSTIQPKDKALKFKDILGAIKSCQIRFDQTAVKLSFQNPALSEKITRILQAQMKDKAVFFNTIDAIRRKNQNIFFFLKQRITDPEQIWSMLIKLKFTKKGGEDIRSFFDYSHIDFGKSTLSLNMNANIILANDPPFTPRSINIALFFCYDQGIISDLIEMPSRAIKINLQFKHAYLTLREALDALKKRIAEKTKYFEGSHVNNTQSSPTSSTSTIASSHPIYFDASKYPLLKNSKETHSFQAILSLLKLILTGGEFEVFLNSQTLKDKYIKQNLKTIQFLIEESLALEDSQKKSTYGDIHKSTVSDFLICFANLIDSSSLNWILASELLFFLNQKQKRVFQTFIKKMDTLEAQMEEAQDAEMEFSILKNNLPISPDSSIPGSTSILNAEVLETNDNENSDTEIEEDEEGEEQGENIKDDNSKEEKNHSLVTSDSLSAANQNNAFAFFKNKRTDNSEDNEITTNAKPGKSQNKID